MTFRCPGGCGRRLPLAEGALVFDRDRPEVAAVMCGPCLAEIIAARVSGGIAVA